MPRKIGGAGGVLRRGSIDEGRKTTKAGLGRKRSKIVGSKWMAMPKAKAKKE